MKTEAVSAFVYQLSTMAYFFIFIYLFFFTSSTLHTVFFFLYSHHPLQIHDHTDGFLQPVCLVSPG